MLAKDIMTTNVVTVASDLPVEDVAELLLARNISGAPVVDSAGHLVSFLGHRIVNSTVTMNGRRS